MGKDSLENLKKLREIVEIMESQKDKFEFDDSMPDYTELTDKINNLIHEELKKIQYEDDDRIKLKSYETLFTSIIGLLEGVKQIV